MNMSRFISLAALLSGSLALAACPSSNNGVAPAKDVGEDVSSEDAGDDLGSPDVGAIDTGPDIPPAPGSITVDPLQITFSDVRQGESATQTIALANTGGEVVVVSNVMIEELNRSGEPELVPGPNFESQFEVGPGLFREIDIAYAPDDYGTDRGVVEIWTTDPDNAMIEIRVETVNAYADLEAPQFVRFGDVPAGETKTERVIVTNRGIDPMTISDVQIGGTSDEFAITFLPSAVPPTALERDEEFVMDVRYSPLNADTDRGTITLTTSDPDDETWEIALVGNDPTPCLRLSPDPVAFAFEEAGDQTTTVTLVNCSRSLPVEVNSIALEDDAGGVFAVAEVPAAPFTINPAQTESFTVTATLAEPAVAVGAIAIDSTDSSRAAPLELRAELGDEDDGE